MGCKFCGFAKKKSDTGSETLSFEEIVNRAKVAFSRGATEVCIQGGLNPDLGGDHYEKIVRAIKSEIPEIHIHAFSPFEIQNGARKTGMSYEDFLTSLKIAGLGTIPGTAAEILDTEIRKQLTRNKLSAEDWIQIIKTAHKVGLRSTATIMYGHIDNPFHWASHMETIREIQKETGGFTEFVPLGFVHYESPLYKNTENVRPGPTREENLKMHAIARIFFRGLIDNIQVSWVKLGPEMAMEILNAGANDLGGTLMNESISRSSGAKYGQEITPLEMVTIIRESGNVPYQRNTLYDMVEDYKDKDPLKTTPLVERIPVENI
jgi:FO synthase